MKRLRIFMCKKFLEMKHLDADYYKKNQIRFRRYGTQSLKILASILILIFIYNYLHYGVQTKSKILLKKQDWHDYTQIALENKRIGEGEKGRPVSISESDKRLENGVNAVATDKIALNRSLPDTRHEKCQKRLYLELLPSVSIVIPFHNEHWTMLLRTLYSVLNRSPKHLIKEIFVVDDASTKESLKEKLDSYVGKHMPSKVEVIRLKERAGLVAARLAGAKLATAEVLVFLDAHIEANVNWLPPLLEPIALDYRVAVCPLVDLIDKETFEYSSQDNGKRGSFDWNFMYQRLPLLPEDEKHLPEPYKTPIMSGGLFAISRKFFWELGGYDTGFRIWGGEQYELSFKIWQCGGRLLDVPCSRVGHVNRNCAPTIAAQFGDYLSKNYRRVVEVWMDEYADYIYSRMPWFQKVDPGDLSEQKALRKKLKCKPFKWFMTQVAFDLQRSYPAVEPKPFAEGPVRPLLSLKKCVDAHGGELFSNLTLTICRGDQEQSFILTWFKSVRVKSRDLCWDLITIGPKVPVVLYYCHRNHGNQLWTYDMHTKQIIHNSKYCLDHNPKTLDLFVSWCNVDHYSQKWIMKVDDEQMEKWDEVALPITGPVEEWKE